MDRAVCECESLVQGTQNKRWHVACGHDVGLRAKLESKWNRDLRNSELELGCPTTQSSYVNIPYVCSVTCRPWQANAAVLWNLVTTRRDKNKSRDSIAHSVCLHGFPFHPSLLDTHNCSASFLLRPFPSLPLSFSCPTDLKNTRFSLPGIKAAFPQSSTTTKDTVSLYTSSINTSTSSHVAQAAPTLSKSPFPFGSYCPSRGVPNRISLIRQHPADLSLLRKGREGGSSMRRIPVSSILIPASSSHSLRAAVEKFSPGSTRPPGSHHPEAPNFCRKVGREEREG